MSEHGDTTVEEPTDPRTRDVDCGMNPYTLG